ncbi:MAG: peptidase [Chloroflexota bacterium]|nr:peptidase [Chloroflexota bacterium]
MTPRTDGEAALRKEMHQYITDAVDQRRDDLIDLLQGLIRVPSQTGEEGAAQTVVAKRMETDGLATDVWEPDPALLMAYADHVTMAPDFTGRPNVVGHLAGSGGGRSLILNAHIDTVEAGARSAWTCDPFGAETRGDRIFGRGACDMKAGLVTHLIALAALRDAGIQLNGDLYVQSTIGEEDGGAGALSAVLRGYRADGAIITEPTNLAVVPAQGGSLMFRLRVEGRSAHACVRDEGVSAVEKFALVHQGLLAFEARRNRQIGHPLYDAIENKVPINIGVVRAGSWPSSVPEWLEAEGRAGLVPGEALDAFRDSFRTEVNAIAARDSWLCDHPPAVDWFGGQFAPAEIPSDAPLSLAVQNAHFVVAGTEPSVEAVTYGADMRHFVLIGQTPCLMYGAGDVRLAHHADESISVSEVVTATKVIAVTVLDWCGTA